MTRLRGTLTVALLLIAALVAGLSSGRTIAEFSGTTANSGNTFSAAASFGAPSATAVVVQSGATSASYQSTVMSDAPVAYWRFGEPVGATSAVDASGNGNHAAIPTTSAPDLNQPGLVGDGNTAFRWGKNDVGVSAPHAAALQLNGSFSIELWVNSESLWPESTERWLLDKGGNPDVNGWRISYDDSRTLRLRRNGVAAASTAGMLGTLATPRHLVVTYDGTNVRWYVDGVLNTTTAAVFPAGAGTAPLTFAGNLASDDQVKIDEPALYGSALSVDRVNAHYRMAKSMSPDVCAAYRVYANITDSGSPVTSVSSVTADLSSMTAGATAAAMTAGSYTIGGVSYAYRSAPLRVGVVSGNYGFSVSWADATGSHTQSNLASGIGDPMPFTPQWLTGFEHGVITAPDILSSYSAGGLSLFSGFNKSGAKALEVNKSGTSSVYAAKDGFNATTVLSFGLRLHTLPTTDVTSLAVLTASSTPLYLGFRAADRKLTLRWGANPAAVALSSAVAGTWQTIDLRASVGSNPNSAMWRVDEIDQPAVSLAGAAQTVTDFRFGSTVAADKFQAQYDDIVHSRVSVDYPIGPARVIPSRPNAMSLSGFWSNFRHEDGTLIDSTTWARLDDPVMNSITDAVQQVSAGGGMMPVNTEDTTEVCLRAVQATVAQHKPAAQVNYGRAAIRVGSEFLTIWQGDSTFVTNAGQKTAVITPNATRWTPTTFNGATFQIGESSDINPTPFWDALLIEYATSG